MYKILIVEDEARIASFLEKGLRKEGYETAIAREGNEAVVMGRADRYDLMLLDLSLPYQDGWSVLAALENSGHRPPAVIVLTSREDAQDQSNCRQASVSDYLIKPFRFQDLLERIRQVI